MSQSPRSDAPCGRGPSYALAGMVVLLLLMMTMPTFGIPAAIAQTQDPLVPGVSSGSVRELLGSEGATTPAFLPVDQAFRFDASVSQAEGSQPVTVHARWQIAPGYYLYRHAFAVAVRPAAAAELSEPVIPAGKPKVDEYFGEVEVYYGAATLSVAVPRQLAAAEVGVTYQGCADAGLCYPPETRWVAVAGTGAEKPSPAVSASGGAADIGLTEDRRLAGLLADSSFITALALFFLGGIGLAFTPCVLPMVPILSSIIVGQKGTLTRGRAIRLSVSYVVGMALTYALVGTLVGLFGAGLNLQAALQSPPVLVAFSGLFVVLALAMFGFWELRLPTALEQRLNDVGDRVGGGRHVSVLLMGALSALVVSPCVSAPLAGALIYLSTTGDAVLGGAALLALGLGMGVPLIIVGASGGHLLPQSGPWMTTVKAVFGVGLLAVSVWMLERVLPPSVTLALWALLAIGAGVYLGALDGAPRQGWQQLWKALGLVLVLWGALLLVGAASGADDPLRPLSRSAVADEAAAGSANGAVAGRLEWQLVRGVDDLRSQLTAASASGRPVLLDLYADWCISCKIMERNVYPQPGVAARMSQFLMLKADVTANSDADRALLDSLGLFGPPSLVFFGPDGQEVPETRVQGEIDAERLLAHLDRVLTRMAPNTQVSAR